MLYIVIIGISLSQFALRVKRMHQNQKNAQKIGLKMWTLDEIKIFMWNCLTINIFRAIIKTFRGEITESDDETSIGNTIPKRSSSRKEAEVRCIWQWSCEAMYVICYIRNTFWTKPCRIASNVFTYARRPRVKSWRSMRRLNNRIRKTPQFPFEDPIDLVSGTERRS